MADPLHIDLDLDVHGEEVVGRAVRAGQPEKDFSGWLELIAALDALIAPSGSDA
jgi:hypothetical protein